MRIKINKKLYSGFVERSEKRGSQERGRIA